MFRLYRVRLIMMRFLLLGLALALTACDSAGSGSIETPPPVIPTVPPSPPVEPGLQSFRFSGVPDSFTVDVPDTRGFVSRPIA